MSDTKFSNIAQIIEQRIDKGDYPVNSKLPTHRVLASELDTTPATVAKAYKLLSDKGRLESFVGRGSFVRNQANLNQAIQAPKDEDDYYSEDNETTDALLATLLDIDDDDERLYMEAKLLPRSRIKRDTIEDEAGVIVPKFHGAAKP